MLTVQWKNYQARLLLFQCAKLTSALDYYGIAPDSRGDAGSQLLRTNRRKNPDAGLSFEQAYRRALYAGNGHPLVCSFLEDLLNRLFGHMASFRKLARTDEPPIRG